MVTRAVHSTKQMSDLGIHIGFDNKWLQSKLDGDSGYSFCLRLSDRSTFADLAADVKSDSLLRLNYYSSSSKEKGMDDAKEDHRQTDGGDCLSRPLSLPFSLALPPSLSLPLSRPPSLSSSPSLPISLPTSLLPSLSRSPSLPLSLLLSSPSLPSPSLSLSPSLSFSPCLSLSLCRFIFL